MATRRRGPSLFEVLSKPPEAQRPPRRAGLFGGWRQRAEAPPPIVAEPLTEEEAAAALAAQHAASERARRPKKSKAEPSPPATRSGEDKGAGVPIIRMIGGRLTLSLNTVGCIYLTAGLCILVLGGYGLGRRSMANLGGQGLSRAAALTKAGASGSPLLPVAQGGMTGAAGGKVAVPAEPDLSELLRQPPAKRNGAVTANRPAEVLSPTVSDGPAAERLNYLQIESFRITRNRSSERLAKDLADVRAFFAARGVATSARRLSNGFVLFAKQGFPPGREHEARRDAFRRRIEEYGQEYRRQGGLYQFKGCLFVSHGQSMAGRPV